MPLVSESHGDPVPPKSPKLLDEPVIQLPPPFAGQKFDDGWPPLDKFGAVSPPTINRIGQSDLFRVATVPAIFRQAHFLGRCLVCKGREQSALRGPAICQLLDSSLPELLHKGCRQANDFTRLFIQREMSRVENMHLSTGHILPIGFSTCNQK